MRRSSHLQTANALQRIGMISIFCALVSGCPEQEPTATLQAFDNDRILEANIRRTDFGVPHIRADNLESLSFGVGYAFAEDNACMLADIITLYNSRRSQYYGPDDIAGSGDSKNLITDFSYLALGIREQAERDYHTLSDNTKAMISGYSQGFNHYLDNTGHANLDPHCANQPWVQPISDLDMLTALLGTALMPGSGQFTAPLFLAAPPGQDFAPTPASPALSATAKASVPFRSGLTMPAQLAAVPRHLGSGLGSNAWALGSNKTESGKGLLLGNPHFPFTGILRFWQFHSTIPGVMDVMGSSLHGTPGIVNIGFNKDLAWSHTFSTAEHFIVYQLDLAPDDASGMTYIVDGKRRQIEEKTLTLEVAVAPGVTQPFTKKVYYSRFGPMISVAQALPWGDDGNGGFVAYSIKDVNQGNLDIVDHWLAMNLASDMKSFKQAFKQYDGVLFNNTLAVDKAGHSFYIDDSTVPNLNLIAELVLRYTPALRTARELLGFSILPGNSILFDFQGAAPYRQAPKLSNQSVVQNSNDSYWLTQPDRPMESHSILYGETRAEQSLRSRLSQQMLRDSAGDDGLFNAEEVEAALWSARSYLAEEILQDLVSLCSAQGDTPVTVEIVEDENTTQTEVDIAHACQTLAAWDGYYFKSSQGAHLFREFAQQFIADPQWQVPFDATDPTRTPHTLLANDAVLQQLAKAVLVLQQAGVAVDATLGDIQFVEFTNTDGTPSGVRFPWEGGSNIDGGFNVFHFNGKNSSARIPSHHYEPLPGSQISAEAKGYHVSQGSSWIMIVDFSNNEPQAKGLLTYSQSIDPSSEHSDDQTKLYSRGPGLRPLFFTEGEISAHTLSETTLTLDLN
ncbi:penicillin acylase family protein [Ketobacter sp.]